MDNKFNYIVEFNGVKFCYSKTENILKSDIHEYHELLFYIDGETILSTETFKQELTKNSLVFIPCGKYHSFHLKSSKEFERLKISFAKSEISDMIPRKILEKISITTPSNVCLALLNKICNNIKNKNSNDMFLYGALLTVLSEISTNNQQPLSLDLSILVKKIVNYVETNIGSDLSMKTISKALNYSVSTITHTFKKEMGISIHQYIVRKRLFFAKQLLDSGKTPTQIYFLCGYKNYSSFYKAYVNTFGISPKN
ncbi:MAG: helix-turn-helix transcriptional regulator [Clostridiales bacterium]|nr:helix-turn-helix transcriptional regulator [Clostridiales bacterium]